MEFKTGNLVYCIRFPVFFSVLTNGFAATHWLKNVCFIKNCMSDHVKQEINKKQLANSCI